MGSIYDVAKKARVSPSTVSRVVNGDARVRAETRQRVKQALAEVGYEPNLLARSLRRRSSQMIGLMVDTLANPFVAELAQAIADALTRAGYFLTLSSTERQSDRLLGHMDMFARRGVDGILLATSTGSHGAEVAARCAVLAQRGIPSVAVGWSVPTLSAVLPDHAAAMALAVGHLRELGHERLAFLAGPEASYISVQRQAGFLQAIADGGAPEPVVIPTGGDPRRAAVLLAQTVEVNGITGIVAASDFLASGALQAAHGLGWTVPRDLSVVGCDNTALAAMAVPPLTTVDISRGLMAELAVRRLVGWLDGTDRPPEPVVETVPVQLVLRSSTAEPRTGERGSPAARKARPQPPRA